MTLYPPQGLVRIADITSSTSVANTETTLFVESLRCFLGGWIILPGNSATWTLRLYIPSTATTAWHTLNVSVGTSPLLVKIGALAVLSIAGTLYDAKVTAQSNVTTAATVNWGYKRIL
jgi:hypothetical protein